MIPGEATDPDRYVTVEDGPEIELKVKGSRFLAQVFRVADDGEREARLARVRKGYYDATHVCWASRLGDPRAPDARSDDDGEPSGTAGVPILGAIERADVTRALVTVTRYYGGTKLGTGGLVRAYGDAAAEALAAGPRRVEWRTLVVTARFAYGDLGTVETVLGKAGAAALHVDRAFEPEPRVVVAVKASRVEDLRAALIEATAGRIDIRLASG